VSSSPPSALARTLAAAAGAVAGVASAGRSADETLMRATSGAAQTAAIRAITLGSLRWYGRLAAITDALLAGRTLAPTLRALLVVTLHQLEYARTAPELTVSSAVDAARMLRQPRAAGLINALLRRFRRERSTLLAHALADEAAASAHPAWLLQALQNAWPEQWPQIVAANNEHPPMTLRLDRSRVTRADYLEQLAQRGMSAQALDWLPAALILEQPVAVEALPGFADGLVSVQDAGAQFAAQLLQVRPGERVLDVCAAPGGKTGALLEAVDGELDLTAVELDPKRVPRIEANLARLRRQARVVTADLRAAPHWWNQMPFDRILLDAPCSGSGVIRRHPDIKLLRRPADIESFAALQQSLLSRCLGLLRPGGCLLYCTCSVLPSENETVVQAVLAQQPRARLAPLPSLAAPGLLPRVCGAQLLPGSAARTDGFYYACLTVT
jgi:16S rRNA (cytosine967-C5)-methyltransferase